MKNAVRMLAGAAQQLQRLQQRMSPAPQSHHSRRALEVLCQCGLLLLLNATVLVVGTAGKPLMPPHVQ
jgi:hypothetical protein